ncbi:MAG: adenylate/guanylate cyclase domain-containing protein [Candidatus Bipolaricaulota bacterium]|nr:MAG: adenylate/guanylate cyclase domain-containing protein [Candidatus Bipolaricaulota bacterium]
MTEDKRTLAALMQTDISGYTKLVARDEQLALELLEEHSNLIRSSIANRSGREIKHMGDSFLVTFPSALQAAQCAVDIQTALVERNAVMPTSRKLWIRIGLHLGDLVHREGDVFGDGVNVLSRIEPLAEVGGIALSRQVYDQIRNQLDLPLESLGERELRNVDDPVELFCIVLPWQTETQPTGASKGGVAKKADLTRILGLTPEVFKHPRHGMLLERLLRNVVRFHQRHGEIDPGAQQLVRHWLANTAELLEGIDSSEFSVHVEDVRTQAGRFLQLVGDGDSVYSTNYIRAPVWWDTEIGEDYLRQKVNASRRGADIVQVMIEPEPEALIEDRDLIERLVGPHGERGSFRIYGISAQELVRDQLRDVFLIENKIAFELDLESRTWIRGFQIYFHPSEAMAQLRRYYVNLMQHDALVEYDPNGLYGGESSFDAFLRRVFPWASVESADVLSL